MYPSLVLLFVFVSCCYERLSSRVPRCTITKQVPILQMTGDTLRHSSSSCYLTRPYKAAMISDALLIFLPLQTLRELKNQPRLRQRLQLIFTASALTTCASIVAGVFNLNKVGFGYFIVVHFDVRTYFLSYSSSPPALSLLLPFSWAMPSC